MVMTINGQDYPVRFGIGFVRELDKKYFVESKSGVKFGYGLETEVPMLLTNDVITLAEVLYLSTCTEEKRPTQAEVDEYIDGVDDIEALFAETLGELKKHNATRLVVARITEDLEKAKQTGAVAKQKK